MLYQTKSPLRGSYPITSVKRHDETTHITGFASSWRATVADEPFAIDGIWEISGSNDLKLCVFFNVLALYSDVM